jgi:DNA repair protein RecO
LGYQPNFKSCVSCTKEIKEPNIFFSPEKGGIICSSCALKQELLCLKLSSEEVELIRTLSSVPTNEMEQLKFEKNFDNIAECLSSFWSYQMGGKKEIKSLKFLQKILEK